MLFLCSHNAARSQIAEALLRHHGGDRFLVFSAGLEPTVLNPRVTEVLGEIGVGTEGQQAKGLLEFWTGKQHFAYTITVCQEAEADCPAIFPFVTKRLYWPTDAQGLNQGSAEDQLERFRGVRDELSRRIKEWLPTAEDRPEFARPF